MSVMNVAMDLPQEIINVLNENGYLEICLRNAKKRFAKFEKVAIKIAKDNNGDAGLEGEIIKKVGLLKKNLNKMKFADVKLADMKGSDLMDQFEALGGSIGNAEIAAWIGAGASIINIGVTVAGFVILSEKMDDISAQIKDLSDDVSEIKEMMMGENSGKFTRLIIEAKTAFGDYVNGHEMDEKTLSGLINNYVEFISKLLFIAKSHPSEKIINFIMELVPVYADLIELYYKCFYDRYGSKHHPAHSDWMSIIHEVGSEDFRELLRDYYVIEKGVHNKEMDDIIVSHFLMVCAMETNIDDTLKLLDMAGSVEMYNKLVNVMNERANEEAKKQMDEFIEKQEDSALAAMYAEAEQQVLGITA